jgi:arylsulfatase A-like enzyme
MKCLLVFVDTLRPDHLGCYGYDLDTSPNIDRLAGESVVVDRCYPTDVPTQPSYTSTFSGQRGIVNGVVTHAPHEWLDESSPWLPSILQANSHATGAVSTLYHMKAYFSRGFSHYMNPIAGSPALTQRVTADQTNSFAIPWLREHAEDDFLLFVHYWDVHEYKAPEEYRRLFYDGDERDPSNRSLDQAKKSTIWPFLERKIKYVGEGITDADYVRAQYDAALRYVDDKLGEVLATLGDLGIMDDTLVVLTSDHGESLGQHSIYFDHASVYEDTARVPLMVRSPDFRPIKVRGFVQLVDLAPTILELAGLAKPPQMQGESLLPLLRGQTENVRDTAYVNQGAWQAKRAMIGDRWKYTRCIHQGFWPCPSEELYDLSEDPGELNDLSQDRPEVLDRMAIGLRRWEEGQIGTRTDPLVLATDKGLTAMKWVWELVKGEEGDYSEWRRKMGW